MFYYLLFIITNYLKLYIMIKTINIYIIKILNESNLIYGRVSQTGVCKPYEILILK